MSSLVIGAPHDGSQTQPLTGLDKLAAITKAAADPLRLQILLALRSGSFNVLELCHIFSLAQPKLSHHLKVLLTAELVATRKEGNSIFYRRPLLDGKTCNSHYLSALFDSIDATTLDPELKLHIEQIKAERAKNSLDFFERNADKFAENQALIVDKSQYIDNLRELVRLCRLDKDSLAIEIGPGEGGYLLELAEQCGQVIALDNSARMLHIAKQNTTGKASNIEFMLGEPPDLAGLRQRSQLILLDMVLHHIASPASVFIHAAQALDQGGHLLLAELTPHNQEWVKSSCGDLWLGFAPEELEHWAESAGLVLNQSLYSGLRNGFQIQLLLFQKSFSHHPKLMNADD